jgi:hypothetical protein
MSTGPNLSRQVYTGLEISDNLRTPNLTDGSVRFYGSLQTSVQVRSSESVLKPTPVILLINGPPLVGRNVELYGYWSVSIATTCPVIIVASFSRKSSLKSAEMGVGRNISITGKEDNIDPQGLRRSNANTLFHEYSKNAKKYLCPI